MSLIGGGLLDIVRICVVMRWAAAFSGLQPIRVWGGARVAPPLSRRHH
jgi:hypothetical protein